jgi:hypothetical protein
VNEAINKAVCIKRDLVEPIHEVALIEISSRALLDFVIKRFISGVYYTP